MHPVAAVEVELSLFALEDEVKDVLAACEELGIALVAYSPLGRGFLAGRYKTPEDLKEGDMRRMQPRFQGESFYLNLKVVDAVVSRASMREWSQADSWQNEIAEKKGVTPAQLALAYIMGLSDKVGSRLWGRESSIDAPLGHSHSRVEQHRANAREHRCGRCHYHGRGKSRD